ncbi:hypothetical protein [Nocardioides currus]|uniref:Uncharacterized protein n=1 Tax=Nocardioides currus TaxID=2133958 RepID=A0A2R7YSP0_9ACTN|nr:hypothetical protein [Nocardioides currus]PUA79410.1 hypothetical protein C7S10_18705 [Nocardioides currus]
MSSLLLRVVVALVLLVAGFGGGVAAALVQSWWWGLLLGLACAGLTCLALPAGGWRFSFGLGWFAALGYVVLPRAEGDYLVPATAAGYTLLGGSFLVFLFALATLPGRGSRRPGGSGDPGVSREGT